jgi:hypothetical protein
MIKHKHHIIPKHMGGDNSPENLIELTVAEHAASHKRLYEQYGHLQDKLAWKGLLGLISTAEIVHTLQTEGMKGNKNPMYGKPSPTRGVKRPGVGGRKKGAKWTEVERTSRLADRSTDAYRAKMAKVYTDPDRNRRIGEGRKGKPGAALGKKWYNDGIDEKYFVSGKQPIGWTHGRINRK